MSGKLRLFKDKLEGYKRFYAIVKTIKMVTLAKFRQSMSRLKTRDGTMRYSEKAFAVKSDDSILSMENVLFLPITTNRGSCGPLNSNIYRYIDGSLNKGCKIMAVGKKGSDSLSRLFPAEYCYTILNDMKNAMHFGYASYILENAATRNLPHIQVVYNRYVSAGVQRQSIYCIPNFDKWIEKVATTATSLKDKDNYQFANAILNMEEEDAKDFFDFHSSLVILNAVCENEHSEYAARLIAVESQMTNIGQLQQKTQYLYNKLRQGNITAALIELLSAMSAMSDSSTKKMSKSRFWEAKQ
ncbi:ATP synthase gamma subunit [Perkinsela sp. CCAP 1560/4]|nr:ATP synthase gamma subunit [Perkinsela sp. CCAP 1560/4]|eukprot:KNH06998.1 ATP synthase gamma subunit [Perkinsela sp. CCAP 1560/4]